MLTSPVPQSAVLTIIPSSACKDSIWVNTGSDQDEQQEAKSLSRKNLGEGEVGKWPHNRSSLQLFILYPRKEWAEKCKKWIDSFINFYQKGNQETIYVFIDTTFTAHTQNINQSIICNLEILFESLSSTDHPSWLSWDTLRLYLLPLSEMVTPLRKTHWQLKMQGTQRSQTWRSRFKRVTGIWKVLPLAAKWHIKDTFKCGAHQAMQLVLKGSGM